MSPPTRPAAPLPTGRAGPPPALAPLRCATQARRPPMNVSLKVLAIGACAALAAAGALAQEKIDGSDSHPLQMNSPHSDATDAEARAAARPTDTEAIGQSTAAPMVSGQVSREEVYRGAVEGAPPQDIDANGESE